MSKAIVVLMSGIPGSGKSTYVKEQMPDAVVCSADHFFMKNGRYDFNPALLGQAHAACLKKFAEALQSGAPEVVVDNTNISTLELAPYVALAAAYGVHCAVITVHCHPEVAHSRNTHGVPLHAVQRMAEALQKRELPPYWDVEVVNL